MWMFNFAYNSLCRLILLAENDSIACCIQDQLHTGILAEPVHHLLPHVAKKCRAVCSTDELHFLLLYAQRAAILNPFQIVQIKYYTLAIIKQVLVTAINVYEVVHLRLQNGRFSVSIPGIAPPNFFLWRTVIFIKGPGNLFSWLLTLALVYTVVGNHHILNAYLAWFSMDLLVTEHKQWWVPIVATYKQSSVVYAFVLY